MGSQGSVNQGTPEQQQAAQETTFRLTSLAGSSFQHVKETIGTVPSTPAAG